MSEEAEPVVLERVRGGLGTLTLNRPRAINALDAEVIRLIGDALDRWRTDPDVQRVALLGAGERGFCAGGDVRALREAVAGGQPELAERFLAAEYHVNAAIAEYPLPVIAFADGVTMGGGIGLAGHASVRIVSERSLLAMPETRIGFVPDVGGTWLLAHAPGRLGEFLALTGTAIGPADAIAVGLADHLVPRENLASFHDALETRADPASATELALLFDETPEVYFAEAGAEHPPLLEQRAWIDEVFAADTVPEIIERLRDVTSGADAPPEASIALTTLGELSPTSLVITLAAVRRARELDGLRAALAMEYGLASFIVRNLPDMPEGIRAQLVDKDRQPRWQPATVAELPASLAADALAWQPPAPLWD